MLSEIYKLKQALEKAGIEPELTHPDFQAPPGLTTYKTLIAKIDENGNLCSLRMPLEDEHSGLWTLKKGNFNYFPAVRLSTSLYDLPLDAEQRKTLTKKSISSPVWMSNVKGSIEQEQSNENEKFLEINPQDFTSLYEKQAKRILDFESEDAEMLEHLQAFVRGFRLFSQDPILTAKTIQQAAFDSLQTSRPDKYLEILSHLFFGHVKKKKDDSLDLELKVQIIFDYDLPDNLAFTLHSREYHQLVLKCLASNSSDSADSQDDALSCAFGGEGELLKFTFGGFSAKPVINKSQAPFSKKGGSAVPCNNRYHIAGSDAFPISQQLSVSLVGALQTITSEDKKFITWRPFKNGKFDTQNGKKKECYDLLIAFTDFPLDVSTVNTFSSPPSPKPETDSKQPVSSSKQKRIKKGFLQASHPICNAFKEKLKKEPNGNLNILLISQISPGQIQTSYDNHIKIGAFIDAIQLWESTQDNLPSIKIPVPITDVELRSLTPSLLFPEEIIQQLTYQWNNDGTHASQLQAPSVGDILDMFLNRPRFTPEHARDMLDLVLARSCPLFLRGAGIMHQSMNKFDNSQWHDFEVKSKNGKADKRQPDPRWHLLKNISLIGTLLYKLNSTKENYMKETTYLLGQLLAYADELHKYYHYGNSKGKLPSRLIGNGLVTRALEDPHQALADLAERSVIYIGWAKVAPNKKVTSENGDAKESYKEKAIAYAPSNARKILRKLEPLSEKLNQLMLERESGELTTEEKAHLFLGYLSPESIWDNPSKENNEENTND